MRTLDLPAEGGVDELDAQQDTHIGPVLDGALNDGGNPDHDGHGLVELWGAGKDGPRRWKLSDQGGRWSMLIGDLLAAGFTKAWLLSVTMEGSAREANPSMPHVAALLELLSCAVQQQGVYNDVIRVMMLLRGFWFRIKGPGWRGK